MECGHLGVFEMKRDADKSKILLSLKVPALAPALVRMGPAPPTRGPTVADEEQK